MLGGAAASKKRCDGAHDGRERIGPRARFARARDRTRARVVGCLVKLDTAQLLRLCSECSGQSSGDPLLYCMHDGRICTKKNLLA